MNRGVQLILFLIPLALSAQSHKEYEKNYNDSGTLISEGWKINQQKTEYWYYYHDNGKVASKGFYTKNQRSNYWFFYSLKGQLTSEGHYTQNKKVAWWIHYNLDGSISDKCQYQYDQLHGYKLCYKNGKLHHVEKFKNDLKIGAWDNARSFKKDNKIKKIHD